MNILYYGLSANQGGIETYLYKIARNINKDEFHLFYMDETGGNACFRKELENLGAKFFDITHRRVSVKKNKKDLNDLFQNHHIDVLHFNCNSLSYITPVLIAKKYGVKIVLHSRNSKANFFSSVLHRLNFGKVKKLSRNIIRIAVSDLAGQWMFGQNGGYEVINNGVEIERFRYREDLRINKRRELGIENKNVYGNVGAFLEAKNHPFILRIFKIIVDKDPKAVLMLVGDGPLRANIDQLAKDMDLSDKIIFLGIRSDIPELMMAMDCLIFPSLYEGFPNVILEAETTGLPIVMSDVITDEVMLQDSCKKLKLRQTEIEWCNLALSQVNNEHNREKGAYCVEQAGFSIKSEIEKIEHLYRIED